MSAPNSLLGMDAVRGLLGMDATATGRTIRRRLTRVAEARGMADFALCKLAGQWFTTVADMRALVPELYAHENRGADTLHDVVADVVAELATLRKRLGQTEAALIALRTIPDAPRPAPVRHQAPNPAQLDFTTKGTP